MTDFLGVKGSLEKEEQRPDLPICVLLFHFEPFWGQSSFILFPAPLPKSLSISKNGEFLFDDNFTLGNCPIFSYYIKR